MKKSTALVLDRDDVKETLADFFARVVKFLRCDLNDLNAKIPDLATIAASKWEETMGRPGGIRLSFDAGGSGCEWAGRLAMPVGYAALRADSVQRDGMDKMAGPVSSSLERVESPARQRDRLCLRRRRQTTPRPSSAEPRSDKVEGSGTGDAVATTKSGGEGKSQAQYATVTPPS
jgi:hypothetical protein